MRLPLVRQGINHVVRYLEKVTQISNIDMNQDGLISWFGYRPGTMRNAYDPMEYQQLIDTQQYSLLLSDGSFFQFYFSFEEQNLTAARLAYYPKPLSTIETQDDIFSSAEEAEACDLFLQSQGLIVRRVASYKLPHCLRITVGDEASCRRVAHAIGQFKAQA